MKIRQAFVANSSSSSFLIAAKNPAELETIENLPVWVKGFVKSCTKLITNSPSFSTKEEWDKEAFRNYGYGESLEEFLEEDTRFKERYYEPVLKAIEAGYIVYDVNVDYNDETLSDMLSELPNEPSDETGMYCILHNC